MNSLRLSPQCPLCKNPKTESFSKLAEGQYFHCGQCDFRFLNPSYRLNPEEERARYLQHNNDVSDPRYQEFVRPLYDGICQRVAAGSEGLDFGAGTGPVLTKLFEESGYKMEKYDPFFWPHDEVFRKAYDFICASEVIEHLFQPGAEILRLSNSLKPKGVFGVMTLLYRDEVDFDQWYYRRDPTHVGFFSAKSMVWIAENVGFARCEILGERTIIFQR